jgi:hypothetical protein
MSNINFDPAFVDTRHDVALCYTLTFRHCGVACVPLFIEFTRQGEKSRLEFFNLDSLLSGAHQILILRALGRPVLQTSSVI